KPKIAGYPFTTLVPNLGVAQLPSGDGFVLADVPGLIEGAADGAGLGHRFLKHLERTSMLVHMVDITSDDIARDIDTINRELQLYSDVHGRDDKKLSQLPQILCISKIDLIDEESLAQRRAELKEQYRDETLLFLSAATSQGTRELINVLAETLDQYKRDRLESEEEEEEVLELTPDIGSTLRLDEGFDIVRKNNVFTINGDRLDRIVSVTNLKDPESLDHMFRIFRAMGIIDSLLAQGIQPGMDVIAGGVVFTYGEDWS
ncbi:MAG: Obg family GTPase CgtA, partial [Cyanobacteria bacterium]|nr:Obg family GTPase CgtA [Cyanobacteriota bacterium]